MGIVKINSDSAQGTLSVNDPRGGSVGNEYGSKVMETKFDVINEGQY